VREHQLRPHCLTHAWANLTAELLHFSPAFSSRHVFQGAKRNDYRDCNVWSVCFVWVCACVYMPLLLQTEIIYSCSESALHLLSMFLPSHTEYAGLWNILSIEESLCLICYVSKQDNLQKNSFQTFFVDVEQRESWSPFTFLLGIWAAWAFC